MVLIKISYGSYTTNDEVLLRILKQNNFLTRLRQMRFDIDTDDSATVVATRLL